MWKMSHMTNTTGMRPIINMNKYFLIIIIMSKRCRIYSKQINIQYYKRKPIKVMIITFYLTLLILLTRSLLLRPTWPYHRELTISSAAALQSLFSTALFMFLNLERRIVFVSDNPQTILADLESRE